MKKFILLGFGLISFFNTSSTYSAELVIGVEKLNYLPFYSVKNKQYHGFARELFDQFASDNGHKVHYKILPVARLFHELINQKVDFKFPDNPHWKSNEKKAYSIQYSVPIVKFTDGVMVTSESLSKNVDSFSHIGTMRGFTPWPLQDKIANKSIRISQYNSLSGLLKQVQLNRIHGSFINIDVALYFLKNHNKLDLSSANKLVFNKNLPYGSDFYYLSSIKQSPVLDQFNQWLNKNKKFHQRLKEKWSL